MIKYNISICLTLLLARRRAINLVKIYIDFYLYSQEKYIFCEVLVVVVFVVIVFFVVFFVVVVFVVVLSAVVIIIIIMSIRQELSIPHRSSGLTQD